MATHGEVRKGLPVSLTMMIRKKPNFRRIRKKPEIKACEPLRNEAYLWYAAVTRDEA